MKFPLSLFFFSKKISINLFVNLFYSLDTNGSFGDLTHLILFDLFIFDSVWSFFLKLVSGLMLDA